MKALVVTVSTRAATGVYEDTAGAILVDGLRGIGASVEAPTVVPDGDEVEQVLRAAVADGYDLVLTTGGTGLTPRDLTPQLTARVVDVEVPGIAEALRADGLSRGIPAAMLSRGIAGRAGRTLVVNLPGSSGGARDGLAVLLPVLQHAVDQIHGGDH